MFQAPLGGISFIANLLIIVVGMFLQLFKPKGVSRRYIVTQDDVARFERGRFGLMVSRAIAYGTPFIVFTVVFALSLNMLYRLYTDERRISLIEVISHGVAKGNAEARFLAAWDTSVAPVLEQTDVISETSTATTVAIEPLPEPDSNELVNPAPEETLTLDTRLVFPLGSDARSLYAFLTANGFRSDFEYRERIAKFFGIFDYTGTLAQNEKLLDILKRLTYDDLYRMMDEQQL